MRFNRTKNTVSAVWYGSLRHLVWIIFPFFLRTIMIYYLGEEYLGVNSLFTSILNVLSLSELGFGSAIVVSMYKPVADDDTVAIRALMKLYRKIYRIIGCIILLVGLALLPFLNVLMSGECPADLNVYILYLLYLASTASTYFLFSYKRTLLTVHQRRDMTHKVTILCKAVTCLLQAVVLIVFKNIYLYVALNVVNEVAINLICGRISDRMYPLYYCEGDVPKETLRQIYKKVSGLFIQKVGNALSTQLDSIVVSAFLGLVLLARYSNYLYIASAVGAFLGNIFSAMTAGIGNCMALESKQRVHELFLKVQFVSAWIVGWCAICLLILYQQFMYLWVGEEMMLSNTSVWCLVIYFYIQYNKYTVSTFKDAAGLWWEDKWKPLVAGLINVTINIVLVQKIGINGVIISTIISFLLVEIPWETYTLYKCYFERSAVEYYKKHLLYIGVALLAGVSTYGVVRNLPSASGGAFVASACVCVVMPNIIFLIAYHKQQEFRDVLETGKQFLIKRT